MPFVVDAVPTAIVVVVVVGDAAVVVFLAFDQHRSYCSLSY